ncbi:MAG: hypothetical protein KDA60_22755, partial [Planctomycetales bacterium]|nr:hypothetical protein [Planctomycetales bacterium]
ELATTFGLKSRLAASLGGRYVLAKVRREQERLRAGWTYEPPTFYERNFASSPRLGNGTQARVCRAVVASPTAIALPTPLPHTAQIVVKSSDIV